MLTELSLRAWEDPPPRRSTAPKVWGPPEGKRGLSSAALPAGAWPTRAGPAVAVGHPAAGPTPVQLQLADLPVQLLQVGLQADVLAS